MLSDFLPNDFTWCCDDLKKLSEYPKADLLAFSDGLRGFKGHLWLSIYYFSIPLFYCPYCGKETDKCV